MFFKIGVLENFANFTGKRLKPASLFKIRLQHRCVPAKFAKFLRTAFFTEQPRRLLPEKVLVKSNVSTDAHLFSKFTKIILHHGRF